MRIEASSLLQATQPRISSTNQEQSALEQSQEQPLNNMTFGSPVVRVDVSGLPIALFRDGGTGEVKFQIPSVDAVTMYKEADARQTEAVAHRDFGEDVIAEHPIVVPEQNLPDASAQSQSEAEDGAR